MRFARVGPPGSERPVVVTTDGTLLDLAPVATDVDAGFLAHGIPAAREALERDLLAPLPVPLHAAGRSPANGAGGVPRYGPSVARPGKIVGLGLNYHDHAAVLGVPVPTEPVVFLKATSSVCGPDDPVRLLPGSTTTDHEVELAVVVGRRLTDATPEEALAAVAGYTLADDLTDRELQLERGGTWTKGKSADTYCPLGPWLVTPDELPAPDATGVRLRLDVNGRRRQDGTTDDMVLKVGEALSYISALMSLEPGDVVITGTPAGVAMAAPEPRPYLRDGDLVEVDGGPLGRHRSPIRAARHTVGHEGPTKESPAWLSTR
jgi:2-keto-4-pentenoate hydratase/2-oxohepta-3-ene-1,7-dioic acid hydratase in catechol pathway